MLICIMLETMRMSLNNDNNDWENILLLSLFSLFFIGNSHESIESLFFIYSLMILKLHLNLAKFVFNAPTLLDSLQSLSWSHHQSLSWSHHHIFIFPIPLASRSMEPRECRVCCSGNKISVSFQARSSCSWFWNDAAYRGALVWAFYISNWVHRSHRRHAHLADWGWSFC